MPVIRNRPAGEIRIERTPGALLDVAHMQTLLHGVERGAPWEIGADLGRADRYLEDLVMKDRGIVLAAWAGDGPHPVGCLILEREDVATENGPVSVWSAGGLYCTPDAPPAAALRLMHEAARALKAMGQTVVCLSANTEKNRRRATYRALGFRKIAEGRCAADYCAAKLAQVIPALEARLRRVSGWEA